MNWLYNPGFEGNYPNQDGINEVKVADGWRAFWSNGDPPHEHKQGPCGRPEYKPLTRDVDVLRVLDGETAQCWFIGSRVMDAGVFQRVTGLPSGAEIGFSVHAHTWCSDANDPRATDGEMYLSLGVDLEGKTDPWSITVRWSGWQRLNDRYREFGFGGFVIRDTSATVFIRAWNKWRLRHNDVYVDGAFLSVVESPDPEPEPEDGPRVVYIDKYGEPTVMKFEIMMDYAARGGGSLVEFWGPNQHILIPRDRLIVAHLGVDK